MGNPFKNTKFLQYFSYWLYVLVALGVPIGLMVWQFNLFTPPTVLHVTMYGFIAILIVAFFFRSQLKKAIAEMDKGPTRTILQNVGKVVPLAVMWFVLHFLEHRIGTVKLIILWCLLSTLAACFIDVWHASLVAKNEESE